MVQQNWQVWLHKTSRLNSDKRQIGAILDLPRLSELVCSIRNGRNFLERPVPHSTTEVGGAATISSSLPGAPFVLSWKRGGGEGRGRKKKIFQKVSCVTSCLPAASSFDISSPLFMVLRPPPAFVRKQLMVPFLLSPPRNKILLFSSHATGRRL